MSSAQDYSQVLSPGRLAEAKRENPFTKLSDAVYGILEDAILSYSFRPGSRIVLSKVAETLGISDSPVREAVDKLVKNGLLLESGAGRYRSCTVFELGESDVTMLYNARKAIESTSAYFCAKDNSNLDMARLRALVEQFREEMERYIESGGRDAVRSDREFHALIVNATGNRYLIEMYSAIDKDLRYLSARACEHMARDSRKENLYKMCRQHAAIYNAIESGFPEMARSLMDAHIDFCANRDIVNRVV